MRGTAFLTTILLASIASAPAIVAAQDLPRSESRRLLEDGAEFYREGRFDEALAAYDRAIQLLAHQQRLDEAYEASMTAGAIARKAGRHTAAAERYRQLALSHPQHPRAAEAHRLAIVSVAQALRSAAASDRPTLVKAYENALYEHLTNWPASTTADDARLWLGKLLIAGDDWTEAREILAQIDSARPQYESAILAIADSYRGELRQYCADGDSAASRRQCAALVADATRELLPVVTGPQNRWPDPWTDVQRHVALAIAQLHLECSTEPSLYAERLLSAVLNSRQAPADAEAAGSASDPWQAHARSLKVVALVRNGKMSEAKTLVDELTSTPTTLIVEALVGVDRAMQAVPPEDSAQRREVAALSLALLHAIQARGEPLDDKTTTKITRCRVRAAVASGKAQLAIDEMAKLATEYPDELRMQIEYAALLTNSDSSTHQRSALGLWQTIEDRCAAGSDDWRRARQSRVALLDRLGQHDEAEKLRRLTAILYPDWNQPARQ